jgi:uncharacterized membrane protein YgcG
MGTGELMLYIFVGLFAVLIVGVIVGIRKDAARGSASRQRQEALFQASFPELQPYFHPENVLAFAQAWFARPYASGDFEWERPTGFAAAARARFTKVDKGLQAEMLDGAGNVLTRFLLQDHHEGAALRIGPGKMTVNLKDSAVRYWHPQREFKWSKAKGWRVINALSDRGIDSTDHGTTFSSDSSSSSSSAASDVAAVAGVAAVVGAGGAFDGGGSSASWDSDSSAESPTSY